MLRVRNANVLALNESPRAPLIRLPGVGVPFERISMGLLGPLEKSGSGFHHILVVVDFVTFDRNSMALG